MPATKRKPKQRRCTCPDLIENHVAMEVLSSAVESEAEQIGDYAGRGEWDVAIDCANDLIDILKAIKAYEAMYPPPKKGGKR